MRKHCVFFTLLLFSPIGLVHATWDVTTPAGTEAKSLGDDRIREFKVDVQTALNYEGDFPGEDTSSPKFIYTPSSGTSSQRPSGSTNTANGQLFINVSSTCLENLNGTTWNCLDLIPSSGVTSVKISTLVAGDGLIGGGGSPLAINYNSSIFSIVTDSISIITGGITSTLILDGTITGTDIVSSVTLNGMVTHPSTSRFSVYLNTSQSNVTGDNTTLTVPFDTEFVDTHADFASNTFTAPYTGMYWLSASVHTRDTAAGNKCELRIITTNRTWTQEWWPTSNISMTVGAYADMTAGNTATVSLNCSGGAKVVDIIGNGGSTLGTGMPTFFSGYLAN